MIKSVLAVAAFVIGAFLFVPTNPAAAGLVAIHSHAHAFHHHRHNFWPYGGVVVAEPVSVVPALVGPAINQTPACTFSRETKSVPSEDGGDKQITITRCQ